jgi:Abortive infection alpha
VDETEAFKIGMEVALRPLTDIAENALGYAGGDWLSEKRRLNRETLRHQTDDLLRKRGVEKPEVPSPSIAIPLLSMAQDESRHEMVDLWSRLIAAAMDPAKASQYRREFADIVKALEPLDTRVLLLRRQQATLVENNWLAVVAHEVKCSSDEVHLAVVNLQRLNLLGESGLHGPMLTPQARQLLKCIED